MNQDQLYEAIRNEQRKGIAPLPALYDTLKKAGAKTLPFLNGDEHLYVRCDGVPQLNIKILCFLVFCINHTYRIQCLPIDVVCGEKVWGGFMDIHKEKSL